MPDTTIFTAKKIITMNPSNPEAAAVAVRDGRILGVGTLYELRGWGDHTLDGTFDDKVLVPGFVEAHAHALEGVFSSLPYVGFFDRRAPDGTVTKGLRSIPAVVERIKELDSRMEGPDETLVVWGLDPIYFPGEQLTAGDLDRVSAARPVFVLHANVHLATVNSALMREVGITSDTEMEGVVKDESSEPNGELQEIPAMSLAGDAFLGIFRAMGSEQSIWNYGRAARNAGLTTVTDLANTAITEPHTVDNWEKVVNDPAFPARVVTYSLPAMTAASANLDEVVDALKGLQQANTDKLRFGGIKLILDGSIQGFTAALKWPGYYDGPDHGLWQIPPEQFKDILLPLHRAGINVHVHCNGDAPVDVFIEAVEAVLREVPWIDHRHTVQHSQLASAAQYRKMAKLGLCANIFANHIWYWGDQHHEITVGPERANRMEACATAKREGVRFSIHSDAPVTPPGHLHTMWCAVNRVTPKGRVLGPEERISVYDALYACTVDAAYQLHMDHEVGSIEVGKRADFTVLESDPFEVEPLALKDIPVWGTVLGGDVFEAPRG